MVEYDINSNKVVATVTDNASNFVKAFKEFGIHNLDEISDDENDSISNHIPNNIEEDSGEEIENTFLPNHLRCSAHTLSLICTTDIAKIQDYIYKSHHKKAMAKCSSLWNKTRSAKCSEIIFNILSCHIRRPCKTRWNSLYDNLNKLLQHEDTLFQLMTSLNLPLFTEFDINFLKEYVECVTPIAKALDKLQSEKNAFYGFLLPTLLTTEKSIDLLLNKADITICKPLIKQISEGFKKRFKNYLLLEDVDNEIIATTIHPSFKLKWLTIKRSFNNDETKEKIKRILIKVYN